ncbi:MAG: transposase, partial [Lachnospiraceae bacterium]|nr:transposase [Lachnospiraceae bacterium]
MAEEIVFGTLKTHDMELCREMLKNTPCFHENDILINDRGFLSREMTNYLKTERKTDTYVPVRENMDIFKDAVSLAVSSGKWQKHPNKKRKDQEIQLVKSLGPLWTSGTPENDVPVNACVVHDKKTGKFFVFMTTGTTKTARQIVQIYELRPEIEEDFRQMKDFWKLSGFKSTQYNYITFHIIMTLTGYLFFQIYKNIEEGQAYTGKSLPVAAKNYKETKPKEVVVYVGQYFGIFPFLEFLKIYAECTL